jgi:hypothetical protein
MKTATGSTIPATMAPIKARLITKFLGRRSRRSSSDSSRRTVDAGLPTTAGPSRLASRRPSQKATAKTYARPTACTGIKGRNRAVVGTCNAVEARLIGPVQGRKFTPAAIEATHARMRRSIPSRS